MKNFIFLFSLLSFCLITSCGGDEEPEPMMLIASATISIDGVNEEVTAASGFVSNSVVSSFDVRYVDLIFELESGGTLTLGLQNIEDLSDDFCIRERTYQFDAEASDCSDIFGGTICEEGDGEYLNAQSERWSDFLQEGSITVTGCSQEFNAISGTFSGNLANFQSDTITISGQFSNIVIIE
jgi:hypothetical protein